MGGKFSVLFFLHTRAKQEPKEKKLKHSHDVSHSELSHFRKFSFNLIHLIAFDDVKKSASFGFLKVLSNWRNGDICNGLSVDLCLLIRDIFWLVNWRKLVRSLTVSNKIFEYSLKLFCSEFWKFCKLEETWCWTRSLGYTIKGNYWAVYLRQWLRNDSFLKTLCPRVV